MSSIPTGDSGKELALALGLFRSTLGAIRLSPLKVRVYLEQYPTVSPF